MKFMGAFSAFIIFLAIPLIAFAANGTMKGDGSAEKPFQIEDYEDLKAIGKDVYLYSADYVLTKDIDAFASKNEMCNQDGCNGFISIGKNKDAADSIIFWGNIDGQNHTIRNLNIWLPCEKDVAFISYLGGSVTNLNFDHISVTGRVTESNYVASVAAKLMGSIKNVYVTNGFVQGQNYVGGIVGHGTKDYNENAFIEDVSFQGTVKGSQRVGGIAGQLDMDVRGASVNADIIALEKDVGGVVGYLTGSVYDSHSNGTIVPGALDVDDVGGIVGYSKGQIYTSASLMELTNYGYSFDHDIGGIVGYNDKGTVYYSYALGNVEGYSGVGGIVGNGGRVVGSFAMGAVSGSRYVGGIAGIWTSVFYSYATGSVEGGDYVGGLVGCNPDTVFSSYWNTELSGIDTSAGGIGLTTAQMIKWESYAGWDTLGYREYEYVQMDSCDGQALDSGWCFRQKDEITRIWDIAEGKSFPYLNENLFSKKALIPIALPTVLPKWQEVPAVASLIDVGGELVGKWTGFVNFSKAIDSATGEWRRDSLYYGYRIGAVVGTDTVWGTSSYVAIPNKIEISTYAELQKIGNDPAYPLLGNYELTADIDAAGLKFKPIGDSVHAFIGRFDGKGHTIKNLVIDEPSRNSTGMFGYAESATIENLTLENVKVTGSWEVGALIGGAGGVIVRHVVSLNGDVVGEQYVGGLVGSFLASNMKFVGTTGKVKGSGDVGGIIGFMRGSVTVVDAFSVNVIKGYEAVGGVIGSYYNYSFGEVAPDVYRVYSASMLKAPKNVTGGIISSDGSGAVDGSTCPYDSTVAGIGKKAKTTAEMMMQSTYNGYDFESVWEIQEGVSYPYFKGMDPIMPGMLEDDGTVNVLAGVGTEINPYKIYNYDDLKYIGKYEYRLDQYYMLMEDIDAYSSSVENCNADSSICKGFEPIGEFSGVFIGNKKKISHLHINRADEDSVGLFRALADGAKVSGIVFDDQNNEVRGKNYVGALAGVDNGATIERVYEASVVSGENYVGGLVGMKNAGFITQSGSRNPVSGKEFVGGLVGNLNNAQVLDCYSIATVSGTSDVGGLIGFSDNATVKNSFSAGHIKGNIKFGGLTGEDSKSIYTSSYYDSTLWFINTTATGELRSTREMVLRANYAGWDFEKAWKINEGSTYPYLAWIANDYYLSKMKVQVYPNLTIDATMLKMEGSGTEKDPFLVKTYGDLKSIGWGKYSLSSVYRLTNDIDASISKTEMRFSGRGVGFKPIGIVEKLEEFYDCYGIVLSGYAEQDSSQVFSGKLYGGGHSIDDLYMFYDFGDEPIGFINSIAENGLVDSLTFRRFVFSGGENGISLVGGMTARNEGVIKNIKMDIFLDDIHDGAGLVYDNRGRVENVFVDATFRGTSLAGVAGMNSGDIINVKVNAEWMRGSAYIGGVALCNRGLIKDISVVMTVDSGYAPMGGIATLNGSDGRIVDGVVYADFKVLPLKTNVIGYSYRFESSFGIEPIGTEGVGGLVVIDSGSIEKSMVSGVIEAPSHRYVGGLIGVSRGKGINGSHTSVDVTGGVFVGGLIGVNHAKVNNSYATGMIKGNTHVGGFVGENDGVINLSFATGNVEGGAGFVGYNSGAIRRSYSTGDVVGRASFVGINVAAIEDCYSTGDVYADSGSQSRGFVEINNGIDARIRGYASGDVVVNGKRFVTGLGKYSQTSEGFYYLAKSQGDTAIIGTGLSSSEMRQQKSFGTFDFDSVWYIKDGVSYPMLRGLPNVPFAGFVELAYSEGSMQAKMVREKLLDKAFVMDSTAKLVLKLDSASETLLDSLEKAGKNALGEFKVNYCVGMLFDGDTVWGAPAQATINLEATTGVVVPQVAREHFNAVFNSGLIAVRFGLESAGVVKFSLFDMQGRTVCSFDLDHRNAGTHFETLAVEGLARGSYVGVLQVNGRVAEKTLLIRR